MNEGKHNTAETGTYLPPTVNFLSLATFKHNIGCVYFCTFLRYR